MVDGSGKKRGGDLVAELDGADSTGEHELDLAAADLLVELHCCKDLLPMQRIQLHLGGQAGASEDALYAIHLVCRQAEQSRGELRCGDLADGDRLPVEILAVARDGFERVADGWPKFRMARKPLSVILPDYVRLISQQQATTAASVRGRGVTTSQVTLQAPNRRAS
jgi:hypothetical protein